MRAAPLRRRLAGLAHLAALDDAAALEPELVRDRVRHLVVMGDDDERGAAPRQALEQFEERRADERDRDPRVASSAMKSAGSRTSARAISTRRRSPKESCRNGRPASARSSKRSSSSSTRARCAASSSAKSPTLPKKPEATTAAAVSSAVVARLRLVGEQHDPRFEFVERVALAAEAFDLRAEHGRRSPGEQARERALSGAVGPADHPVFAGLDRPIDVVQHARAVEDDAGVRDAHERLRPGGGAPAPPRGERETRPAAGRMRRRDAAFAQVQFAVTKRGRWSLRCEAQTSVVRPAIRSSKAKRAVRARASSPEANSSSSRIRGAPASARAIRMRRRAPCESVRASALAGLSRPSSAISASTLASCPAESADAGRSPRRRGRSR